MDRTAVRWTGRAIRDEGEGSIFGFVLGWQDAGEGNARYHQHPQGQSEERGAGCDHARTGPCVEDSSRGGFPSGPIGLGGPTGLGFPPGMPIPDMPLVGTRLQAVVVARQMSKRALPGPQGLVISGAVSRST